jgi:hypothetical protein
MDVCNCGRVIEQPASGRRRKYCFVCSPPNRRGAIASVSQFPVREQPTSDRLTQAVTAALDKAGILESWQAASCLALANLIDAGKHGASGAAGTVKALRDAMAYAMQSFEDEGDVILAIFNEK